MSASEKHESQSSIECGPSNFPGFLEAREHFCTFIGIPTSPEYGSVEATRVLQ